MAQMRVGPADGEQIPRGSRHHRVLAELPELEAVDACFGRDFVVPPHKHDDHVDAFYIVDGEADFTVGDEVVHAAAGTWIAVPVGTIHSFRNVGDGDHRILNIHVPNTGFVERLRTRPGA
jgi:quercetin dioxygenase-like cupin family protein